MDEAIEIGADAIILGLPYRKRFGGDFAIGGTIPYVFQNAPCQVIVAREPIPSVAKVETVPPADKIPVSVGSSTGAEGGGGSSGWSLRNRSRGNGRKKDVDK